MAGSKIVRREVFTEPKDPHHPVWGEMAVQRRGHWPGDGPFSYPFALTDDRRTVLIGEWEWDSGVGVLLGEQYRLAVHTITIHQPDGSVIHPVEFKFTFDNDFTVSFVIRSRFCDTVAPMVHWPSGNQLDMKPAMGAADLLALFNQVMAQSKERKEAWT